MSATIEDLQQTLVVNPHLNIVHCSEDEIVVKHGSRSLFSETIVDDGRTKLLGRVLSSMQTPTSLHALRHAGVLDETTLPLATEVVEHLRAKGVLVEPESDLTKLYLDTVLNRESGVATELGRYSVGLVGAGPLGSRIARELAGMKVARLQIVDNRRVTNAQAAVRYLDLIPEAVSEDVNLADALTQHLQRVGPESVQTEAQRGVDGEALDALFRGSDFVVVGWEHFAPTLFHALNEVAVRHRRPWLLTYCDGSEAIIGPLYVPGETSCYYEFETQSEASIAFREDYLLYKEHLSDGGLDSSYFALPPYLQIAAGFTVLSAAQFLVRGQAMTVGRSIRIDFERLSVDYQDVLRLPRCPACGSDRAPYRQLFL